MFVRDNVATPSMHAKDQTNFLKKAKKKELNKGLYFVGKYLVETFIFGMYLV